MQTRRAYGAGRALRHIAAGLAKLAGPVWPLAPVAPSSTSPSSTPPASSTAIDRCSVCHGDHVCPMDWGELDETCWWIVSRCGDCGTWSEVALSNAQAAALDVALDRQEAQIRAAADRLDAERMADQASAFVAALERDLICAADF